MVEIESYRNALSKAIEGLPLKGGRMLVTGASGLIGSCIIDMLLLANEQGCEFEIYALGRNKGKLIKRFYYFVESPHLHFVEQDIRNPLSDTLEYDYIIHGASNADPRNYALYPAETMLTNLKGTANILEYCRNHKETKMLLLSTFEVYGDKRIDEYSEADFGIIDANQIRSAYPESKRSAEILTRCYIQEFGVYASIARLCSIYGPTMIQNDSKAHAQFIRNALKHEDVVLKSNGNQRRTYCFVIDAVMGLLTVLAKGEKGEAYNISYEGSVATIAEVAQTVAEIAGTKVVFELPDEIEARGFSKPQHCILKNDKLHTLGWQGRYSLKEGLIITIRTLADIQLQERTCLQ